VCDEAIHKGLKMLNKNFSKRIAAGFLAIAAITSAGCLATHGVSMGLLSVPVPVSPYHQTKAEDDNWVRERYSKVPILGPVAAGGPHVALDPPSDDEVMRAFLKAHPLQSGIPFLYDIQRNDVRIVKEKIADYIDPPRFYPMIGPAQLHHAHYKCTVYYSEVIYVGWPMPHTLLDEEALEVLYIDHNHLHMVGNVDGGNDTPY